MARTKENCPLLELLLDSRAHPYAERGTPLAEAEMPGSLVLARSAGLSFQDTLSSPSSYLLYDFGDSYKKKLMSG